MAGGKYDKLAGKTRPGTYINFESDRNDTVGNSERGIVLLPLIGYDFGPAKTPITLTAAAPDAYSVELGRSVYDATNDKMRLIREAFKKASKVIVYITESGTAATGTATPLTVTAKYGGTRGNDIHVSVVTNPVGGFDVTVYLDADATAVYEGVKTVEELIAAAADDKLVKFTGTGDLKAASGVKLAGGTQHFSLMPNDQTNIDSMFAAITLGASEYPYHPDGGKCVMYSAADIITLYSEYKSFVTKQTTYCNALRQWAKRETDPNVIGSIYYGCTLPEDLEKEVEGILSAAQAQIVAIINKLSA